MSIVVKKTIPMVITFLVGFLLLVTYFLDVPVSVSNFADVIPRWCVVIVSLALGVGVIKVWQTHIVTITKRKQGEWPYSVVALATFVLFVAVGLINGINHPNFRWIYDNLLTPPFATTYAIWGFFIASACFRILRFKNIESGLLILSAVLIMLSNVALGELIWAEFPLIGSWIKTVPMMAVFRALTIGVGIGLIILGLRTLIGLEKGYAGEEV